MSAEPTAYHETLSKIIVMIEIRNDYECFVQLWLRLERTRQMLGMQYKRFCIRRVLQTWLGSEATDDFIWAVCFNAVVDDEQLAVKLGIGMRKVNLKALDRAYSEAFPHSTPINVNKKKREPP